MLHEVWQHNLILSLGLFGRFVKQDASCDIGEKAICRAVFAAADDNRSCPADGADDRSGCSFRRLITDNFMVGDRMDS